MTRTLTHIAAQLSLPANLVPARPGRTAPRARKRGGSHRYPRRADDAPAVRAVTHTIELRPIKQNQPRSP